MTDHIRRIDFHTVAVELETSSYGRPVPVLLILGRNDRRRSFRFDDFSFPDDEAARAFGRRMADEIVSIDNDLVPHW